MATTTTTEHAVEIRFTRAEKILGLLRDAHIPFDQITAARVVASGGDTGLDGLRAPGLAVPGMARIGTWRGRSGRTLVALRSGQQALVLDLEGHRYQRVVVGADASQEPVLAAITARVAP